MAAEHDAQEHKAPSGNSAAVTLPARDSTSGPGEAEKPRFDSKRGGKRGRGGGGGGGRGGQKRKDLGRNDYYREGKETDRRPRNNEWRQGGKRRRLAQDGTSVNDEASYMNIQFSKEEIESEERRPKRKVAVMVGYAGTGYHGMQINHKEKTIEGDLFAAFVTAQAISKVNANDPKKSSLVRCARTDKGVHAAGNVLSLKLIIEDPDVVKKINDALPPQIRVWGIQRTNNAFSCYQQCDSRWYEYLMPSYCLLPPHPESFMGKKVIEAVAENGLEDEYASRLAGVKDFWEEVEKNEIQPIIDSLEPKVREDVLRKLQVVDKELPGSPRAPIDDDEEQVIEASNTSAKVDTIAESDASTHVQNEVTAEPAAPNDEPVVAATAQDGEPAPTRPPKVLNPVDAAIRRIKDTYINAKRRYRVTPDRLSKLQEALDQYVGTHNFHNYTVQKSHNDPSSKRNIKSFVVNTEPVQINDTQWLSLKVHGQSFMMHQIRKMVGMAVLVTRCGTDIKRIAESYEANRISIPKAPSLGLLLERPVFTNYNNKARETFDRPEIDFANYEEEIQNFKDQFIYRRIFEVEEQENSFHTFFNQIDNFKSDYFLWVTAGGVAAAHKRIGQAEDMPAGMTDQLSDDEDPEGGEG
ncbi:pseudouridine synthase [Xylariales sp. PMI_506]|nr:pseudouridine synthase [Xylariales sp. PMI_506]